MMKNKSTPPLIAFGQDIYTDIADTANSKFAWLIFARRLGLSASLLDNHSVKGDLYKDVTNVARMCMGMAIECYFKAYFIASGNVLHDGNNQNTLGSHNLRSMAKEVGFTVTEEQEKVLHYLSMFVKVKERYPVPLKADDMKIHPSDRDDNPLEEYLLVWNERSDEACMEVVIALEDFFNKGKSAQQGGHRASADA